jgi:hypothetical protein
MAFGCDPERCRVFDVEHERRAAMRVCVGVDQTLGGSMVSVLAVIIIWPLRAVIRNPNFWISYQVHHIAAPPSSQIYKQNHAVIVRLVRLFNRAVVSSCA